MDNIKKFIKINKYEVFLPIILFLILFSAIIASFCILTQGLKISCSDEDIYFDDTTEDIKLKINLENKTFHNISKKDKLYLTYQLIDYDSNIILDKNESVPLNMLLLSKKEIILTIKPPPEKDIYTLKLYTYSDKNISNLYTDSTAKLAIIYDYKLNIDAISIDTNINEITTQSSNSFIVPIKIKNNGNLPIYNELPMHSDILAFNFPLIAYHIYDENNTLLLWDGKRNNLQRTLEPFEEMTQKITIDDEIFNKKGKYILEMDLVQENFCWLSERGMNTIKVIITVN